MWPWKKRSKHLCKPEAIAVPEFLETTGWEIVDQTGENVVWRDQAGLVRMLSVLGEGEGVPLQDDKALIEFGRSIAESRGGGLVSMERVSMGGLSGAELLYKRPEGSGYVYIAMLFVYDRKETFVISASFGEGDFTGTREAVVTAKLLEDGKLQIDVESREIPGWFVDPYQSDYKGPVLRSLSDDETYDEWFPEHPLTGLRHMLVDWRGRVKSRTS